MAELSNEELQKLNALAIEVDIDTINIGERVRRDFSHVPDLAESIKEVGLIQPIVLTYDRRLIAGESRIRACKTLGWKTIRAVFRGVLDEAQLVILEATENNARQNLTWQERCLSVDKVHRLRTTNAALAGESWGVRETGALLKQGKSNIQLAVALAEYLHANDQEIWKAESASDAFRILAARKEKEANALLVKLTIPSAPAAKPAVKYTGPEKPAAPDLSDDDFIERVVGGGTTGFAVGVSAPDQDDEMPGQAPTTPKETVIPLSQMLRHGDALQLIKDYADGTFNHVITDWPYGIDMENFIQNVDATRAEHGVDANLELQKKIVPELFRVLRPGGFFITWTDMANWQYQYELAISSGFVVQRWPLVWLKTSANANQAAQYNFTKNYEIAIVCRKGGATLVRPQPSSVWTGGNDTETKLLGHPFAKPFGLWTWLYEAVCKKGDTVLDPFAGVGSSTIPAIKFGLRPTSFELVKEHWDKAVVNVSNVYKSLDPNVKFS